MSATLHDLTSPDKFYVGGNLSLGITAVSFLRVPHQRTIRATIPEERNGRLDSTSPTFKKNSLLMRQVEQLHLERKNHDKDGLRLLCLPSGYLGVKKTKQSGTLLLCLGYENCEVASEKQSTLGEPILQRTIHHSLLCMAQDTINLKTPRRHLKNCMAILHTILPTWRTEPIKCERSGLFS